MFGIGAKPDGINAKGPGYKVILDSVLSAKDIATDNRVALLAGPACQQAIMQLEEIVSTIRTFLMLAGRDCRKDWREENIKDADQKTNCAKCLRPRPPCLMSTCKICSLEVCDYCHHKNVNICTACALQALDMSSEDIDMVNAQFQLTAWTTKATKFNFTDAMAGQLRGLIKELMRYRSDLLRTIQVFHGNDRARTMNNNMNILSLFPPNTVKRSTEEEEEDSIAENLGYGDDERSKTEILKRHEIQPIPEEMWLTMPDELQQRLKVSSTPEEVETIREKIEECLRKLCVHFQRPTTTDPTEIEWTEEYLEEFQHIFEECWHNEPTSFALMRGTICRQRDNRQPQTHESKIEMRNQLTSTSPWSNQMSATAELRSVGHWACSTYAQDEDLELFTEKDNQAKAIVCPNCGEDFQINLGDIYDDRLPKVVSLPTNVKVNVNLRPPAFANSPNNMTCIGFLFCGHGKCGNVGTYHSCSKCKWDVCEVCYHHCTPNLLHKMSKISKIISRTKLELLPMREIDEFASIALDYDKAVREMRMETGQTVSRYGNDLLTWTDPDENGGTLFRVPTTKLINALYRLKNDRMLANSSLRMPRRLRGKWSKCNQTNSTDLDHFNRLIRDEYQDLPDALKCVIHEQLEPQPHRQQQSSPNSLRRATTPMATWYQWNKLRPSYEEGVIVHHLGCQCHALTSETMSIAQLQPRVLVVAVSISTKANPVRRLRQTK